MKALSFVLIVLAGAPAGGQALKTVAVESGRPEQTLRLPGEFLPFQAVELHARVNGFVESVNVDRGSQAKKGQLLVTLSAPEMKAQLLEAEAKVKALEAQRLEAGAKVVVARTTHERLKVASGTPGAIAGVELIQAEKALEAAEAAEQGIAMSVKAAEASVAALRELESYLNVTAPFDGIVSERFVHPGALAGPGAPSTPLLKLEQISRLRLVVAVPETAVSGIVRNARVSFTVPAYPGQTFRGVVARIGRVLDPATRTMPVELDIANTSGKLSPGMYPEVQWPVRATQTSLLVPPSSVVTTSARSFVIRVKEGMAEWVDVRTGPTVGERVAVYGELQAGDQVVLQANDEIRNGSRVQTAPAST